MRLRWSKGKARSVVAGVAAAATLLAIGAPAAMAGGGGGNQPGSGGGLDAAQFWQYRDGPDGSWGPATSLDSVRKAMKAAGVTILDEGGSYNGPAKAQAALDQARRECESGFNQRHPSEAGQANCRVVAVGAVAGSQAQGTNGWNGSGLVGRQIWLDNWNKYVAPVRYFYNGTVGYYTNTPFTDNPSDNVNKIMERNVHDDTSIAVIVLDKYQPAPPVVDYDLTITTDVNAPQDLKTGSTGKVSDTIHASQSRGDAQQVNANVIMHYDGNKYTAAKNVTKSVKITTKGDTRSPEFAPSDFGWSAWPSGSYWFDVQVPRQGHMKAAVDTADREASESFRIVDVPPAPPVKQVEEGVSADAMRNTTTIESGTGRGGYAMTFRDVITPNGVAYTIENMKVTDKTDNNKDISNQFTMTWDQAANTVTAVRKDTTSMMPLEHTYVFQLDVVVSKPDINKVTDQANVLWNDTDQSTEQREFPTWNPNPDKSWIKQNTDGSWAAVIDPDETNATGADQNRFLDGDKVASVVNGTVSAHLIEAPTAFELTDDWAKADYIFDADDVSAVRVYMAEAQSDRESSVSDIANKGTDVTSQFDITIEGTKAVAAMKDEYLKGLQGLEHHRQYSLLVPGKINFANGGGAEQVRKDAGREPGAEVDFCTVPGTDAKLTNAGSQTVNGHRVPTNEPWICGYVPPVVKDVVSESSQGGEQESVDGKVVFPGQKVEYQLTTQPKLPGNLAYQVEHVAVTDSYDEHLVVDKQTLEVTDLSSGKSISKKQYTTQWDDTAHMFTLTFADAYVAANWRNGQHPRIMVRFEGTVSEDAPADTKVDNQWLLTLNNTLTPSNKVFNIPPDITPDKQDTQKDPTINIDGKTALLGDRIYYRIGLDLKNVDQNNLAYRVQRAGIVDDYDDGYLTADETGVEVLDEAGKDVTDRFNIQFRDGIAYVFAKTVDTQIPATGETLKGDPQPEDLKAYAEAKLDPLKDAYIDQALLGQKYQVVLPMTVTKVQDGYTVVNKAVQVTNDRRDETNVVSNPLKEINPSKDVVVNMGDESANGKSIYLGSTFLYQLDSSILPADRAYQQVSDWKITDKLDTAHDRYTGQWAVYATRDLKDGETVLAAKGARIAGTGVDSAKYGGDLFATVQTDDGTVTVTATQRYLDLVSASNAEAGFRAYIQCTRIAVGDKIVNAFREVLNGVERPSNEVWTRTPDQTPSIDVEKYDIQSGEQAGDRDDPKQALKMEGADQEIGIKVTNTGKVDLAKLTLKDALLAGSGELKDIQYPKNWDTLVLKPGQSVTLKATLKGVKAGDKHTNRVSVTGTPVVECPVVDDDPFDDKPGVQAPGPCYDTPVHDSDDWNAYRVQNPVAALASTGAGITALVVSALAAVAGGVTLVVLARRRANSARHVERG
ncbi:LPXTG cell wall anchor domain-containing protein [Bifidobacterium pseudolongum subsp. globosum]|uniref:LPXTG cell wall anchor domain-containing protein n=1 Tax=Bifidobacterium pseudolongum TaxID=1694 RepID=UPI000BBF7E0E|nr:LPXTG cell wall anchor domain-containing protein [Bifidobacterium pseudolongum]ASW24910.1 adhesin isopeptide-forming adherence domain protein [Bifidobacterium pseudolongum]MCI1195163.1 LPXTG cell wall anchor domain-containing protein [Bifidobacterium pseudolongum subsp. globosum]UNP92918.1 LPXTG cell wall anchor domain-containing protein [Bifidobacterium pseudolongum subsp. globosum]UNZ09525.1 LPXTG cell wall anchor domain-containing protein [Bifidobacterium pseudolongum subsp. globosum]